ncbi:hypothetical protein ACFQMH_39725 [Streptomyces viridiviolaceus]|uniref:Lipoprotein n=1 Tax=Streptomyces viridiviolaceus TaxID=68282 RepID=A0ABW2EGE1_9ACTN|nr:hypothetical protein [Streptomyces viridiviolaceus]
MALAVSASACSGEEPQPKTEPAVPAAEMKSVEKIEGNADVPEWVTSRTFPGLTYVKYSEYHDATAEDLSDALDRFGGTVDSAEAIEYWEEQGVSSAKEALLEAHVTEGDLMQLCQFALGRLPERSVVLIRNFDKDTEVSANMNMGAGDEPSGCEKP